jgi:hypothetical protein
MKGAAEGEHRTAMPDEPDKPSTDDAVDSERPTVSPPFDPVAAAGDMLKPSNPPNDTHTKRTPAAGTPGPVRRQTPKSAISLANQAIPSNLPPRPAPKEHESLTSMNAVDREWADMEIATRPPPADSPGQDPEVEIGSSPKLVDLDLDEIDRIEHEAEEEEQGAETLPRPMPAPALDEPAKPRSREMSDRMSLGDYSGALGIAEKILADDPDDDAAKACAESCRTVLRQMYQTRIGPLDRVPVVMVPRDQLRWLSIDHKAGFVLSLVDGVSNLEMIIDVSGMPELDTLRILSELAQQRIISLR